MYRLQPLAGDEVVIGSPARATPQRSIVTADATPNRRRLERIDRQLLTFVLNWAPYGGPPEDECFLEFGMAAHRVRERCVEIVCASPSGYYSEPDFQLLVSISNLLSKPQPRRQPGSPGAGASLRGK
jgi:hypothetical protein